MIKMIASDLDGTLLNSKKEMPTDFGRVVEKLADRGIRFVAASGRGRKSLKQIFGDIPVAMVSDNGATAYNTKGERIFTGEFDFEEARTVLNTAWRVPYMTPVLISTEDVYLQEDTPQEVKDFMTFYFRNMITIVPDVMKVFDREPVIKISINTGPDGAHEDEGLDLIGKVTDYIGATLSGDGWLDVQKYDVNKGASLLAMGDYYGIRKEEILAFGDYLNDYEFLKAVPESYAMKNAHPKIKEICRYVTRYTNDENGVVREIDRLFDLHL